MTTPAVPEAGTLPWLDRYTSTSGEMDDVAAMYARDDERCVECERIDRRSLDHPARSQ